jgi:hypothetical protein
MQARKNELYQESRYRDHAFMQVLFTAAKRQCTKLGHLSCMHTLAEADTMMVYCTWWPETVNPITRTDGPIFNDVAKLGMQTARQPTNGNLYTLQRQFQDHD